MIDPSRKPTWQTRAVKESPTLGRANLTHSLVTYEPGTGVKALRRVQCGRVEVDNLSEDLAGADAPPTCPRCLRHDPRFLRKREGERRFVDATLAAIRAPIVEGHVGRVRGCLRAFFTAYVRLHGTGAILVFPAALADTLVEQGLGRGLEPDDLRAELERALGAASIRRRTG